MCIYTIKIFSLVKDMNGGGEEGWAGLGKGQTSGSCGNHSSLLLTPSWGDPHPPPWGFNMSFLGQHQGWGLAA